MKLRFNDGGVGTSFISAGLHPLQPAGVWLNAAEVLSTRFLMFTQGVAIRREVFQEVGGFDEQLKVLEDYDLALRLSFCGPWAFLREPLVEWNQGIDSLSHVLKRSALFKDSWRGVLEKALSVAPSTPSYALGRRMMMHALRSSVRERAAVKLCERGDLWSRLAGTSWLKGQRICAAALRRAPWYPKMNAVTLD
jgi:hypothetical protein